MCQKSVKRPQNSKVPLISVPVVSEPFKQVAVDIIGPLPKSKKGNRYILTLVDYATRYPEAVALSTIDTETIADELINIFSRVGLPDEILTRPGFKFHIAIDDGYMSLLVSEKVENHSVSSNV